MYFFTHFEVSLGNTKAKVECVCFFIYITQITTLENGNHETCMGHPFFSQKMGLKPQIFKISLGIKMNVDWVCFSIYLYHINHPLENGNHETGMSQHLFLRKMRVKTN